MLGLMLDRKLLTVALAGSIFFGAATMTFAAEREFSEPSMITMEAHPEIIEAKQIFQDDSSDGKKLVVIDYAQINFTGHKLSAGNLARIEDINGLAHQYAYKRLDEYVATAQKALKEGKATSAFPYKLKVQPSIVMADENGISILTRYDVHMGGKRPNYWYSGMNFDAAGNPLKITDICTDIHKLCEVLKKEIKKTGFAKKCTNIDKSFVEFDNQNGKDLIFVRNGEAVYFYFSPYSLAPYEAGCAVVKLEYARYRKLLKKI